MGRNIRLVEGKKPKRRKSGFVWVLVAILLIITAQVFILFSPFFNIKYIDVLGQKKVSAKKILELSGICYGQNIFKVSFSKAINQIENNEPYVEKAKITHRLPNCVVIDISERVPVGAVEYMGSYILVDNNGYALEITTNIRDKKIVELRGINLNRVTIGKKISEGEMDKLKASLCLLSLLEKNNLISKVEYIDVKDIKNVIMFVDKRLDVKFGDAEKLNSVALCKYRLDFLKAIIEKIPGNKAGEINLTADNPVFKPIEE
ncbi:MAG: cell division protein FtsQ/DivIB [Ignavibacteriales bacterium]